MHKLICFVIFWCGISFGTAQNLINNGSFEDSAYAGGRHEVPESWTVEGPSDRGGLHRNSLRASDGEQYVPMGGWTNESGMELSQTVVVRSGAAYQLSFDAGINSGSGDGNLLVEVLENGGTSLSRAIYFQSGQGGMHGIRFRFVAGSGQVTVRFTHASGTGTTDLDLDHVRLEEVASAGPSIYESRNGYVEIEAEEMQPAGYWKNAAGFGEVSLLYDPPASSLAAPLADQKVFCLFRSSEAASYHFALKSSRIRTAYSTPDPGGKFAGDIRNNDVWFALYNHETGEELQAPIRHLTGNWGNTNGLLKWGNLFQDANGSYSTSRVALEAETVYRLELSGRGDGYLIDRISIRSEALEEATELFVEPAPGSEHTPKLPLPDIGSVDLAQYPAMERWSLAGVTGGIRRELPIRRTLNPGDDIEAALHATEEVGGGVVMLKRGTYSVSSRIDFFSNTVLRGEDRDETIIEFHNYLPDGETVLCVLNEEYSGIENLTMKQIASDGSVPRLGVYGKHPLDLSGLLVLVRGDNNWVKDCNVINSGGDVIVVSGQHNTLTNNFVEGAYNKQGGTGYYRVTGSDNLIKGEIVKAIRHFGILSRPNSKFNVVTDCFFDTDINFHSGDEGDNLFEGNTVALPRWHRWNIIGTGGIMFDHMPPGSDNLFVNNYTYSAGVQRGRTSEPNRVYTLEGFGVPLATDIPVPEGGRFYVAANPQLTFVHPTPPHGTFVDAGTNIRVEVGTNAALNEMKLYRDDVLVRTQTTAPYTWGADGQGDELLQDLKVGRSVFRVVGTLAAGGTVEESFTVTVVEDSYDLERPILGASSYQHHGTRAINGTTLGQINNGRWVRYHKLRIGGANGFRVKAASDFRSGVIEIRKESPTGPVLGRVTIPAQNDWGNYQTFTTESEPVVEPADIYLTFVAGNGWSYNIESFSFFHDGDTDRDGVGNLEELELGTDPRLADSDNDGFRDGDELAQRSDPRSGEQTPLVSGLVAYYPFNEVDGAVAFDRAPERIAQNAIQAAGIISRIRPGLIGDGSLSLDGSSFLEVASAIPPDATELSVSVWVKPDSLQGFQGIYVGSNDAADPILGSWGIALEYNRVVFQFANSFGELEVIDVEGAPSIVAGEWLHLAMTWETDGSIGTARIYVDGRLRRTVTSGIPTVYTSPGNGYVIGSDPNFPEREFAGQMDDLAIFTRRLNDVQIAAIHSGGELGNGVMTAVLPAPLVAAPILNFRLDADSMSGSSDVSFLWPTQKHAYYEVHASTNLKDWLMIAGPLLGTGADFDFTYPDGGSGGTKFYIVQQR